MTKLLSFLFSWWSDKSKEAECVKKIWKTSLNESLSSLERSEEVLKLNSDSLCIDCGANVGDVSSIFAKRGSKVIAFEPNSTAVKFLKQRFTDNANVVIYEQAVGCRNCRMKLYKYKFDKYDEFFFSQGASLADDKDDVNLQNYEEVEVISLSDFIEKLECRVNILKMDVEGMEYDILLDLIEKNLYQKIDYILVETHDRHISSIIPTGQKVRKLIETKGIKNINLNWC